MGKRQYTLNVKCNHEGCNEWGHYSYDTRKEYNEGYQRNHKKYKCIRHIAPNEVLNKTDNTKIETILTASKSKKYPDLNGLFWNDGSGFNYGSGYQAHANDFPEGTILKITAEIILP